MFQCNQCDYRAHREDDIKKPLTIHKNIDEEEIFKCDQSEYRTSQEWYNQIY